jgi:hypothetical protein
MRWVGYVAEIVNWNVDMVLLRKREGDGYHKEDLFDNIKMDVREITVGDIDWTDLAESWYR